MERIPNYAVKVLWRFVYWESRFFPKDAVTCLSVVVVAAAAVNLCSAQTYSSLDQTFFVDRRGLRRGGGLFFMLIYAMYPLRDGRVCMILCFVHCSQSILLTVLWCVEQFSQQPDSAFISSRGTQSGTAFFLFVLLLKLLSRILYGKIYVTERRRPWCLVCQTYAKYLPTRGLFFLIDLRKF